MNDQGLDSRDGSFEAFYGEAHRKLRPTLRGAGANADDILHDAMVIVYERWEHVRTLEHPMAWARTVAHRLAARHHARESRRDHLESAGGSRQMHVVDTGMLDLVPAMEELRPQHAAALRMIALDDLDVTAAAQRLGVPPATAKVWVHRGREKVALRAMGMCGRWVSEATATPRTLTSALAGAGHGAHIDAAMPLLVDRSVRWELHVDGGSYWLGTDDGEQMDVGRVRARPGKMVLHSKPLPQPGEPGSLRGADGTSIHGIDVDGDRLHVRLISTDIPSTNGVPDEVFRSVFFHDIVYRWRGPLRQSRRHR